jgi:hypothetical protein
LKKKEVKIRTTILLDKQLKSGTVIVLDGITYKVKSSLQEGFLTDTKGCFTVLEAIE